MVAQVDAYEGPTETSDVATERLAQDIADSGGWIVFTIQDDVVMSVTSSPEPTIPTEYCG